MHWTKRLLPRALRSKRKVRANRQRRTLRLLLEPLEARLAPAILTVNSLADGPVNLADATVTLRDAIDATNNDVAVSPGGPVGESIDEIRFQAGLSGTINLNQGQLGIRSDLTITGTGANVVTVSASGASRVFEVTDNTAGIRIAIINGLTITAGKTLSGGGGIFNQENLTVRNCAISGNSADNG